ncbi:MAG: helicase, partial [Bacteroides sp.]|nr:helicase [Bacteroides sp.]
MKRLAVANVVKNEPQKELSASLSKDNSGNINKEQEQLEQFLLARYDFRFNVLTEQTEYRKKGENTIYKVISQRTLNSLCLEARTRHINCWDK